MKLASYYRCGALNFAVTYRTNMKLCLYAICLLLHHVRYASRLESLSLCSVQKKIPFAIIIK